MADGVWLVNFTPAASATVQVGTSTNTYVTFTDAQSIAGDDMLIANDGTNDVYWAAGTSTATTQAVVGTATPAYGATPVEKGAIKSFKKGSGNSVIALISTGSTCTVNVTFGIGQ